jgi:hypothetical protein
MFEFLNKKKGGLELISGKTPQHFFKKHLSIFFGRLKEIKRD